MIDKQARPHRSTTSSREAAKSFSRRDGLRISGQTAALTTFTSTSVLQAAEVARTGLGLVIYVLRLRRQVMA
ncbi:MAG: hypothetical protein ACQESR_11845 [Planctomycetota bacterium]